MPLLPQHAGQGRSHQLLLQRQRRLAVIAMMGMEVEEKHEVEGVDAEMNGVGDNAEDDAQGVVEKAKRCLTNSAANSNLLSSPLCM